MKKCNKCKILSAIAIFTAFVLTLVGCAAPVSNAPASQALAPPQSRAEEAPASMAPAPIEPAQAPDAYSKGEIAEGGYYEDSKYYDDTFNTEEYNSIEDNGFKKVKQAPLSTFSSDVDTASYSNIRRMITDGMQVTPDAVRIEEMINYFDYDYKSPQGKVPFSVTTEISGCEWNRNALLLMVGVKGREIATEEMPPSNIVFLLDVSGSMNDYDKLPLLQDAFSILTDNLRPQDTISIVVYAGEERVILEGARGSDGRLIKRAINSLSAGGSTAGSKGIITAYEIAQRYFIEGGNNRVILATDGDLNVGVTSEGDLKRLVEEKRDSGVFLSVLGFGTGNIKDNKMETLADNGNGNYFYIDSIREAKKVLQKELSGTINTIAKDVKFQVEFNPDKISEYRLIGYENRKLNDEDFDDDKKDAGDIGAGHTVTALYEIIPANNKQDEQDSGLKYQEQVSTGSPEWLTVKLRYKEPDAEESKLISRVVDSNDYSRVASNDLKFASSVAQFGMLLRDSEYKGKTNYTRLLNSLNRIDNNYMDEYKAEFVDLVEEYTYIYGLGDF